MTRPAQLLRPVPLFLAADVAVARRIDGDGSTGSVRGAAFMLLAHAAIGDITRRHKSRRPVDGFGDIDPTAAGGAEAAAAAVAARYAGLIEEISRNPGLTPEQRAAAISGLRQQQAAESAAASKRIMDAAKGAAKARRMMRRNGR